MTRPAAPPPRLARPGDAAAVSALLSRSYGALLAGAYPAETLARALPAMTAARPELLRSGRWFVTEEDGALIGCGGWSAGDPETGASVPGLGHVRHVACDPAHLRRGVGRAIWEAARAQGAAAGIARWRCLSTLPAAPFYAALGFLPLRRRGIALGPGTVFEAVEMARPGPEGDARCD